MMELPKNPKILFIQPNTDIMEGANLPPLGILYISAYLRQHGFKDIKVVDALLQDRNSGDLEKEIKAADVVGVTAQTPQAKEAQDISRICKKYGKPSIIGGVHASLVKKEMLERSAFDVLVKYEGEVTFLELLKAMQTGSPLSKIDGIIYRKGGKKDSKQEEFIETKDREFYQDLDNLPFPARDLVPLMEYSTKISYFPSEYTHLITSRGCPNDCIFCCSGIFWKRRIRMRSAENIFAEIVELNKKYGFSCFYVADDTFSLSKKRVSDVCDLILKSKMDIKWHCLTRPGLVDIELLEKMKKAGCIKMSLGAESGDEEILKAAKKNYTTKQVKESLEMIHAVGIPTLVYFMVGLPGETVWTYLKTVKFARSLRARAGTRWCVLCPYPGTDVYDKGMVKILNADYESWRLLRNSVIKVGNLGPKTLMIMAQLGHLLSSINAEERYYEKNPVKRLKNMAMFVLGRFRDIVAILLLGHVW